MTDQRTITLTCQGCGAKNPRDLPYNMMDDDHCTSCGKLLRSEERIQPLTGAEHWPADAKFGFGDKVERADFPNGRPPAYRFPGRVCGWYRTPSGNIGFAISNLYEPACIQIFPQSGLKDGK